MKIVFLKQSITDSDCEAIVNAANDELMAGGGVCGAIFRAAGNRELQDACDKIGGCKTGNAVITPGFKLKAKHVIHAVGPIYRGDISAKDLEGAYYNSLKVADENRIKSIAFPAISTGIYGYPLKDAAKVTFDAIEKYFENNPKSGIEQIEFDLIDDYTYSIFERAYKDKNL